MVTVSVPGKVHLMGEHAVVYGAPALLAAVNLRLRVSVDGGTRGLEIVSSEPPEYVRHAVDVVRQEYKRDSLPSIKITVVSDIPAGYHLGSSAAVAVGVAGAMTYYLKKVWNPASVNQIAYEIEKTMHGNPSGGDNTAVTMGGFIWFRKELEFLKSIWQLPFKLPQSLDHFFLIDTGRPKETTGEMVAYVKSKVKGQKSKFERLFVENERQVRRIAMGIKEGNEKELIDAICAGERTLEGMGVVSKAVIPLIRSVEKSGGAAKILGGGGRKEGVGYLLAYHRGPAKWKGIPITLGEEGIRLEARD